MLANEALVEELKLQLKTNSDELALAYTLLLAHAEQAGELAALRR